MKVLDSSTMNRLVVFLILAASALGFPQNKTFVDRIINGQKALPGQFPWQVLLLSNFGDLISVCGGALISNEFILTASHCVDGWTSFTIYLGSTTFNQGTRIDSTEGYKHEKYNPETSGLENDIAVIRLSRLVAFSDTISAIALQDTLIGEGVDVTVSGWGKTNDDLYGGASNDLNYVNVTTISLRDCQNVYEVHYGDLYDGFVCTGSGSNPNTGVCSGDSGGPLVTNNGSSPVHVGVACFANTDVCAAGDPSGFTQTGYFRNWIRDKTGI